MNFTEVAIKSTPPAVLTVWSFMGFSLNEWAAIAAITYSVLMIFFLISDRFTKWRKERNESGK
jgi:disulfide bond formation protein DsbB